MIISKTPLRLCLGGGSTDLPAYSNENGGFVVTSALNRHVYLLVKNRFEKELKINYSTVEIVEDVSGIKHPVVREALKLLGLKDHIEVISSADVPAETGLGSSGSFTVGLIHALHGLKDEYLSRLDLAKESTNLIMNILKEPCGCQDTYIASFGGFVCLDILKNGNVIVTQLHLKYPIIRELENNLLFFYTGIKRSANIVLKDQSKHMDKNLESMHEIKHIGHKVKHALETGNLTEFGLLQHSHWMIKRLTSSEITNDRIDKLYDTGIKAGAIGGKLMGAGGGGFLVLYCENHKDNVRKAMAKEGLQEIHFRFEDEGSKLIINIR